MTQPDATLPAAPIPTLTLSQTQPCAGKLTADGGLTAKLEGAGAPDDGYHALLRLAWGLLLAQHGAESAAGQRMHTKTSRSRYVRCLNAVVMPQHEVAECTQIIGATPTVVMLDCGRWPVAMTASSAFQLRVNA